MFYLSVDHIAKVFSNIKNEILIILSLIARKPVFGVSDLVRYKPGCATSEYGLRIEISDLGSRRIVLFM